LKENRGQDLRAETAMLHDFFEFCCKNNAKILDIFQLKYNYYYIGLQDREAQKNVQKGT